MVARLWVGYRVSHITSSIVADRARATEQPVVRETARIWRTLSPSLAQLPIDLNTLTSSPGGQIWTINTQINIKVTSNLRKRLGRKKSQMTWKIFEYLMFYARVFVVRLSYTRILCRYTYKSGRRGEGWPLAKSFPPVVVRHCNIPGSTSVEVWVWIP